MLIIHHYISLVYHSSLTIFLFNNNKGIRIVFNNRKGIRIVFNNLKGNYSLFI